MDIIENRQIPELLAPAGSSEALAAAIEGGADAVYFGGTSFSNRMRAKNFTDYEIIRAVGMCAATKVNSYITINTRLRDRELPDALNFAKELWAAGASAFIIADLGLTSLITREIPDVVIHASTQMTGMNALDAEFLKNLGFSRMVCPRELSMDELKGLVKKSPIEIEAFVHGAHCVSVSGQCLMSWAMGGRSGNRGECAQPCRLPYRMSGDVRDEYVLSLKDMCLACHIPALIDSGVSSLKIEGRLKSPDYVYGVTKIYRQLLDERRGATPEEIKALDEYFSRDGFTDGYFKKKYASMNGVRGENKISSAKKFMGSQRKIPISGTVRVIKDEPLSLTFSDGKCTVCVTGDVVDKAKNAPATKENLYKNISKLGGTPFEIAEDALECITDGESFVVASQLNELRRKTIFELREAIIAASKRPMPAAAEKKEKKALVKKESIRSAEFMNYSSVSKDALEYFHRVFLPEGEIPPGQEKIFGLALPVWETSEEKITASVKRYCKNGGKSVLAHSYSHIDAAVCEGLDVTASLRLNITSVEAANVLGEAGVHRIVLSPELTGAAVRDINKLSEVSCGTTVYGHLPIMTLRRCMMYDKCRTHRCKKNGCLLPATLSDRKGAKLKVFPLGNFMNLIVNPNTVWCADRSDIQNSFGVRHFIFTDESASKVDRIINSYKNEESSDAAGVGKIKRL